MRSTALLLGAVLVASATAQTPTEDAKRLKGYEKTYLAAKAALTKKKDAKTKQAFVKAGTLYGHESMMSSALPAKVKYRQALRINREVLKVDPNQTVAKQESGMIISIYKQMGRPVPQG